MLDPSGEDGVVAQGERLLSGRTVLVISHRPSVLALAHRVLRLEDGVLTPERRIDPAPLPA